jgi:hypothetical protein
MESDVRDLYGASPPADLPHEITLLAEQQEQQQYYYRHRQSPLQGPSASTGLDQNQTMGSPPTRWSPNRMFGRFNNNGDNKSWLLSPFSLDGHDKYIGQPNSRVSLEEQRYEPSLNQPLLPSLQRHNSTTSGDHDDEELGGPLLGEAFSAPSET